MECRASGDLPDPPVLPNTGYFQYGDAQSYSMPILNYVATGSATPTQGDPYYVPSGPGQIMDCVVIATGTNNGPVNSNFPGMDDAYRTPDGNGSLPYFSTTDVYYGPGNSTSPDAPSGPAVGDSNSTWDSTLAALTTYLNGGMPVFMFNNNQVNSGASTNQELFVWAQISIVDLQGQRQTLYYDFNAMPGTNHGGIPNGDVTTYTSAGAPTGNYPVGPNTGDPNLDDFVRSGGAVCILAGNIVPCGTPGATTINHNLGADRATYAVIFPELNDQLYRLEAMGYDLFRFDFRMGCNPQFFTDPNACVGQSLNNGYEQLFLLSSAPPVNVPEPATIGLLGLGLLGLGLARRCRKQA
ncbi:MAG: PEP-CTERM sorting domain-containing protein [Thiobacillus sp.]